MITLKDAAFNEEFESALEFAKRKHGDQRYKPLPYIIHPLSVVNVLIRFGFHPENDRDADKAKASKTLILAAVLHDVIEDTDTNVSIISMLFNKEVAELVDAVSNEPGKNRKEKHKKSYGKIINSPLGLTLKLADRISNAESCKSNKNPLLGMYRKEWDKFSKKFKPIAYAQGLNLMWDYLEFVITK